MRSSLALAISLVASSAAGDFLLQVPVDCNVGSDCHIQNYFDHLPSEAAQDYRCGALSYDGHKGTDFAVPTLAEMRAGVDVLAAASGEVRGVRDGMPDVRYAPENASTIENRECGNGVVIAHANGWETQYCHMRQGSVRVTPGDGVQAGAVLGQIGLSGKTQFPHLHLSVRKDGRPVDPFVPDGPMDCTAPTEDLWAGTLDYQAGGLLSVGFSDEIPDYAVVLDGTAARTDLSTRAPALVLFGLAFGGRAGDVMRLEVSGPQGMVFAQDVILEKTQAQVYRASGRRLTESQWKSGTYTGTVDLLRNGMSISRKTISIRIGNE